MRFSTRFISMVLAVVMAVSCLSICVFAQSEIKSGIGFVTASALRLRSEPSTDSSTIDVADNNEVVVVLDRDGDWYHVIYDLQEGYMHAAYLSVLERENAELGWGEINDYCVNLRSGPDTSYSIVNQAYEGEEAYIIGLNCGWYKVIFEDDVCYVRSDLLDLTEYPYENRSSSKSPIFFRGGKSIGAYPSADALANGGSSADESDDDDYYEDSSSSSIGQQMADMAESFVGYSYVWGGSSPSTGFDCSGLTYYIARQFGFTTARGSESQYSYGTYVEKEDLQPGDYVFFANTYTYGISHCGVYIGDGNFVHASGSTVGVVISSLDSAYYIEHYHGARRLY